LSSAPEMLGSRAAPSHGRVSGAPAGRFAFSMDWVTRPLFGFLLAGIAIWVTFTGGLPFVVFVSLGCAAGIREWHRFFAKSDFLLPASVTIAAMIGALLIQLYGRMWFGEAPGVLPFAVLAAGALCNSVIGLVRHEMVVAHAAGPFYIGLPGLALLMLRQSHDHPIWVVLLVLLSVWATDTGALFSGKLIGGPKLAPSLSPNKTWAGSLGGLVCAAIVACGLAAILNVSIGPAAVFAMVISASGQLGDLFESMVKRRTGHKDSGGLIPGHGGVLDRIDSILFAAPVACFLVLTVGFHPLAGLAR
jgi:phosphatidate cytidylyltransferase